MAGRLNRTLHFETCESRRLLAVDLVADVAAEPRNGEVRFENQLMKQSGFVSVGGESSLQLFETDGTVEGTRFVAEQQLSFSSAERKFHVDVLTNAGKEFDTPIGKFFAGSRVEEFECGKIITRHGLWFDDGTNGPKELYESGVERQTSPGIVTDGVPFAMMDAVFTEGRLYALEMTESSGASTQLIESDGTVEGTRVHRYQNQQILKMASVNGDIFISVFDGLMKKSAGEDGDFKTVWRNRTGSVETPRQLTPAGDRLFFVDGIRNLQVRSSDGMVNQITNYDCEPRRVPSSGCARISIKDSTTDGVLLTVNGTPYFSNGSDLVREPFRSTDAVVAGGPGFYVKNFQVYSYVPGELVDPVSLFQATTRIDELHQAGDDIYFNADEQLWIIRDGQEPAALGQIDIVDFMHLTNGETLLIGSMDGNQELWRTDGTVEGTELVLDFVPGTASAHDLVKPWQRKANGLTVLGGKAYAVLIDGIYEYDLENGGHELILPTPIERFGGDQQRWSRVEITSHADIIWLYLETNDLALRQFYAFDEQPVELWSHRDAFRSELFRTFELDNDIAFVPRSEDGIWISDGTWAGTRLIEDRGIQYDPNWPASADAFVAYHPYVTFRQSGNSVLLHTQTGKRLSFEDDFWFSEVNDRLLAFSNSEILDLSNPESPALVAELPHWSRHVGTDEDLVFYISDETLWRTDGSEEGTLQLSLREPSGLRQFSPRLTKMGDAYFVHAQSLFFTDGVNPSSFSTVAEFGRAFDLTLAGDQVFYLDSEETDEAKLWVTDVEGRPASQIEFTEPLMDLELLGGMSERLVFAATHAEFGRELWTTDGTQAGTRLLRDINQRAADGYVGESVMHEGRLYFAAVDEVHGNELWSTDGTTDGTRLEEDLLPGPQGSTPTHLVAAENRFLFFADDGVHGRELFQFRSDALVQSDLDGDGEIGFGDFLMLSHNFGEEDVTTEEGDLTGDGLVSFEDFLILSAEFGKRV